MIKQYYSLSERPRVHISSIKEGCTCWECCHLRDEDDERQMVEEHDVAKFMGQELFDALKVGDQVEYYRLPYDERKTVYLPDSIKWELIKEKATATFQGTITSKTGLSIEIDTTPQKITPAACWAWGLRKIN